MFTVEEVDAAAREAAFDNHPDLDALCRRDPHPDALDADLWDVAAPSPGGFAGLELDITTADPARLSDAQVIDAIVGFEQVAGWAGARQARLLAEFARRRPGDDPKAGISDHVSGMSRWAPDEVGLALTLSRMTAAGRLAHARQLTEVLDDTLHAWESGRLDGGKVRAITDACFRKPPEQARAIQDRVLGRAPGQTVAQVKRALARAVIATDPDGAAERHQEARRERRVRVLPAEDGMATLWACLSASDALTCFGWLTALARGMGDDPRTMDQRRADLLVALVTGRLAVVPADSAAATVVGPDTEDGAEDAFPSQGGSGPTGAPPDAVDENDPPGRAGDDPGAGGGCGTGRDVADDDGAIGDNAVSGADAPPGDRSPPAPPSRSAPSGTGPSGTAPSGTAGRAAWPVPVAPGKPLVQVLVPYSTLTGADDAPVELVGYGPIPAPQARDIAADGVWRRLVTDPLSGALLDHGRTVYRPPAALADFVRARDVTCRFPPCNRRAIDGELDHTRAWTGEGGETCEENLYGGCVHHHHLHHDAPGWTVQQDPDGTITWTTPTGHRYSSRPYDYRPEPPLPVPSSRPGKRVVPARRDILGRNLQLIEPLPADAIDDAPF